MGFHPDWIERQLAHDERNKVRAAYNHAQYLPSAGDDAYVERPRRNLGAAAAQMPPLKPIPQDERRALNVLNAVETRRSDDVDRSDSYRDALGEIAQV